ncbi:Transmembrane and coiled-coil domain-containing protein 5B [Tupaia chinensis]|uniref:Transmembrane and coiled-coil domain-containing protein 5B n=1 Tax=Tupaia chinensis TaxID=246437 RepID=L9L9M5_TUPCH|nr:Transmembrane and coiled-coil domain-containing protein 5B [Tupaia chinensis]
MEEVEQNPWDDVRFKNAGLEKGTLKQMLAEMKVRLQKSTESCAKQEKELVKKYQEILRQMEKEKEVLLLEMEMHFRCLVFMVMIFIRLLGYMLFYLQYINPDLLTDALDMVMSRGSLKRLRDVLFPFLTLEVEELLPH